MKRYAIIETSTPRIGKPIVTVLPEETTRMKAINETHLYFEEVCNREKLVPGYVMSAWMNVEHCGYLETVINKELTKIYIDCVEVEE